MALEVHLTDDRVVPDILLDGPFERFAAHVDPPYLRPWALILGTFNRAQLGAAGAGIALDFRRCRNHRPFRPDRDPSLGLERPEGVLHDSILEGVKRNDRHSTAGVEPAGRPSKKPIEPLELSIHPDADRLKRACGRIDPRVTLAWNRPANDIGKPPGRGDRRLGSRRQDCPCHAPRMS